MKVMGINYLLARNKILEKKNSFTTIYLDAESTFWRRNENYYNFMIRKANGDDKILKIIKTLKALQDDDDKTHVKEIEKLLNEIK